VIRGRSSEAVFWSLFSAGGIVAALFLPVLIAVIGVGSGFGWDAARRVIGPGERGIDDLLRPAAVRAVLGLIIALVAVHAAHRVRHLLIDFHAPIPHGLLAVISYGGALAIAAFAAVFLLLF
jgi:fumarate reductase subunit D